MICRLCRENRDLRKSHIIPEFLYKPIYDSKHRLPMFRSGRGTKGKPRQKGIREKLLCEGCEQQLSRNEKYWHGVLFGGTEIYVQSFQDRWVLSNLDYAKVRLFFLSLIWRMGVASEDEMWKNVHLGPHEEPVRKMVHSENAGEPSEYGVLCIVPLFDGKPVEDWLLDPDPVRSNCGRWYRLFVGGCVYLFHISNQRLSKQWSKLLIRKHGSWQIRFQDIRKIPFLYREAIRMSEAMRT